MPTEAFTELLRRRMPRMMASGIDYNDAMTVAERGHDIRDWIRLWLEVSEMHEALGDKAARQGRVISAGEAFARAAVCIHWAQAALSGDRAEKDRLQRRQQHVAGKGLAFLRPPAEIVDVAFEDFVFPARLRVPRGDEPKPVVVLNAGADSTKEEFVTLENEFLCRGVATCSYDGPGQSLTWHKQRLRPDFERPVGAVLDVLVADPRIDAQRIGIWGRSLGAYAAPRVAACDHRIKACVSAGGFFDFHDAWDGAPKALHEALMSAFGTPDLAATRERARDFSLKHVSDRPGCPVLIVHSEADRTAPVGDAERIRAWAGPRAEVIIFPEGTHVCDNIPYKVRPMMTDWIAQQLAADPLP